MLGPVLERLDAEIASIRAAAGSELHPLAADLESPQKSSRSSLASAFQLTVQFSKKTDVHVRLLEPRGVKGVFVDGNQSGDGTISMRRLSPAFGVSLLATG